MAALTRTNQVYQVVRHLRTPFGAVVVNLNKIVSAFSVCSRRLNLLSPLHVDTDDTLKNQIPEMFILTIIIYNEHSKIRGQRDSNDNLLVNSQRV